MKDVIISYYNDGLYTLDNLKTFIGVWLTQSDYDAIAKENGNDSNN